jgi:hypothetical protein
MTISIKDLISSTMRNSPNFSGSPKVGGENIPTMGSDGELKINGQSIIAKTREYKLPSCWQQVADYTRDLYTQDLIYNGYGFTVFSQTVDETIIYIDPTATTNGVGTFVSPYNMWPATIPNNCMILLKEYTSITTTSIVLSSTDITIGTYDSEFGERVIEPTRLATIIYGASTSLFTLPTIGSFVLSGVKFHSILPNTNNIIKNTNSNLELKIEYCLFNCISSVVSGSIVGCLIETSGNISALFNSVLQCNTDFIKCSANAKIACNKIITTGSSVLATGVGSIDIHNNYIISKPNTISIINVTTSSSCTIRKNYIFGGNSEDIGTSYCVKAAGSGVSTIMYNYICNSTYGIYCTSAQSKIYKNIVCSEYENYTGITGGSVVGNTVVRLKGNNGTAISATNLVSNNIIDSNSDSTFNIGIKTSIGLSQTTHNNITGAAKSVVNSVDTELNIVASTNTITSSYLDCKFYPLSSSPALTNGLVNHIYDAYGIRGAIYDESGVGLALDVFSPTNGLSTLQSTIDNKADLASPSFVGSVMINGNTPQVTLFKDFGTESFKTSTGVVTNTLGTYTLPNISGSGLLRITMVYVTGGTGSKTISVKLNGNIVTETTTTIAKISRIEIICANNVLQTGQIYTVNTDGNTTMTASSVVTSGVSTFTVIGTGTISADTISLKSMIIEQI